MPDLPYRIVDVFAARRYAGNQLAVVDCTDADVGDDRMGRIAAEFDFSETTFVEGGDEDGWDVRIFTPAEEIPFAGHPTLGTAATIREHLAAGRPDAVTLHLGVGDVPVWVGGRRTDGADGGESVGTTGDRDGGARGGVSGEGNDGEGTGPRGDGTAGGDRETLWMRQRAPSFGRRFDREAAARAVSLSTDDLRDDRPVRRVSTGLPTIVVPLADRAALERAGPDPDGYEALTAGHDAKNVLAYCADPRDDGRDYAARVFAPYYDVPEDPATGSSNGCLAAYLVREGGGPVAATVEQGFEMGRPSLLELRAREDADAAAPADGRAPIVVEVGGRVFEVAEGRLL